MLEEGQMEISSAKAYTVQQSEKRSSHCTVHT